MIASDLFAMARTGLRVVSLTSALALDHAKDRIRVNCIAPGSVRTPMLVEADDVARLVLFLASDEARTISGACYRIDGGLLARLGS
jgi:meso-butanediol dehydrogenase/(S,S)-butanediol dehydrogenase/diacetyl reductase